MTPEYVGHDKLRHAIRGILIEQFVEDGASARRVAIEEVLAIQAPAPRRVVGDIAEQIELVGVQLAGDGRQLGKVIAVYSFACCRPLPGVLYSALASTTAIG